MNLEVLSNEVMVSISPAEDDGINISIGWDFDDDINEDVVDYHRKLAAGIYGLLSARIDDVLAVGDIVEATTDFGSAMDDDDDEMELVFTPDDELLDKISEPKKSEPAKKVVDLKAYKFNPKKHNKH